MVCYVIFLVYIIVFISSNINTQNTVFHIFEQFPGKQDLLALSFHKIYSLYSFFLSILCKTFKVTQTFGDKASKRICSWQFFIKVIGETGKFFPLCASFYWKLRLENEICYRFFVCSWRKEQLDLAAKWFRRNQLIGSGTLLRTQGGALLRSLVL